MKVLARALLAVVLLSGPALMAEAKEAAHSKGSEDPPRAKSPPRAPPGTSCWCCRNLSVSFMDARACTLRAGRCSATQDEAQAECTRCWCCAAGQVSYGSLKACQARNGSCSKLKGAAEAVCNPGK